MPPSAAIPSRQPPELHPELLKEIMDWDPFTSKTSRIEQQLLSAIRQGLHVHEGGEKRCTSGAQDRHFLDKCQGAAKGKQGRAGTEDQEVQRGSEGTLPAARGMVAVRLQSNQRARGGVQDSSSKPARQQEQRHPQPSACQLRGVQPSPSPSLNSKENVALEAGKQQIQEWARKALQDAETRLSSELQHRVFELMDIKEQALQRAEKFGNKVKDAIVQLQIVLASCEQEKEEVKSVFEEGCGELKADLSRLLADYKQSIRQESTQMLMQHAAGSEVPHPGSSA